MANCGGGALIIGVKEKDDKTLEAVGLTKLEDDAKVINGIKNYLPYILYDDLITLVPFVYDASEFPKLVGKKFQALFVENSPRHLPFVAMNDGTGIRKNAIYIRRGTSTEEANYDDLQKIFNVRIATAYTTRRGFNIKAHLSQLHALQDEVRYVMDEDFRMLTTSSSPIKAMYSRRNPRLKDKDYEDFIFEMIDRKKKRIADELDA